MQSLYNEEQKKRTKYYNSKNHTKIIKHHPPQQWANNCQVVGPTLELHVGPYVILFVGFTLAHTFEPTCWPNVCSTLAQRQNHPFRLRQAIFSAKSARSCHIGNFWLFVGKKVSAWGVHHEVCTRHVTKIEIFENSRWHV